MTIKQSAPNWITLPQGLCVRIGNSYPIPSCGQLLVDVTKDSNNTNGVCTCQDALCYVHGYYCSCQLPPDDTPTDKPNTVICLKLGCE